MEVIDRSFRLERTAPLLKLGRSHSSILISESVSVECARITAYEKLSESFAAGAAEPDVVFKKRKSRVFGYISEVFGFRKVSRDSQEGQEEAKEETQLQEKKRKEKKRRSWLPDPDRRWPVQGW